MGIINTALRVKQLYEEGLNSEKLAEIAKLRVQGFVEEKTRQGGERILGGITRHVPYGNYVNQKVREYTAPSLVATAIRYSLRGYNGGMSIERKRYGEIKENSEDGGKSPIAYFKNNHIQITRGEDMEKALGEELYKTIRENSPDTNIKTLQRYFEKLQIAHERGEKVGAAILKRNYTKRDHAYYELEFLNSLKTIAEYDKETADIYRTIAVPIYRARQKAGQAPLVMPSHDRYLN